MFAILPFAGSSGSSSQADIPASTIRTRMRMLLIGARENISRGTP
jgi:hypothetical protein